MIGTKDDSIIYCWGNNDTFYYDSSYYLTLKEFIDFFELFKFKYHSISLKYGINVSYFDRRTDINEKDDISLNPNEIFGSMFYDSKNDVGGIPCYMYIKDTDESIKLNLQNNRYSPLIDMRCFYVSKKDKYAISLNLYTCNFFPQYLMWDNSESKDILVDNSDLFYLNTTRYNSYIRELKRLFKNLNITDYNFASGINEFSKDHSIHNKEELLKIGNEVIFYEDVYDLLKENERYKHFEEISL